MPSPVTLPTALGSAGSLNNAQAWEEWDQIRQKYSDPRCNCALWSGPIVGDIHHAGVVTAMGDDVQAHSSADSHRPQSPGAASIFFGKKLVPVFGNVRIQG
jgi:hypothetical protein